MKKEIISYLSTEKTSLSELCKFLYDNPEESYVEYKAYDYITNFLKQRQFDVKYNFENIETSFLATKGNGHPRICFLCEYDAVKGQGHLTGHNLLSTISVAAAIGLGHIIDKTHGSVHIIGCPGEYRGGVMETLVHQGVFKDMDVVMVAHPDVVTSESGTSSAIIPLSIKYIGSEKLSFLNQNKYTALDAILLTFNIINSLLKGLPKNTSIDSVLSKGGYTPLLQPLEAEAQLYIRSESMATAAKVEKKIREGVKFIGDLMNLESCVSLNDPHSEELLTNITLSRLCCHNLKEAGIIDVGPFRNVNSGLSIGAVSQKVPTIHPYIRITEDNIVQYGTKEFAQATISEFGIEQSIKAALALCYTSLDIIENENLLGEVKSEFFDNSKCTCQI